MGLLSESEKLSFKSQVEMLNQELSQEKRKAEKYRVQLVTNADTGLPNSVMLHKELDQLLTANSENKAVFFIAFDESFNMLKRSFATKIPEWILYQTSLRLQKVLHDRGRLYHTSEEEFFILLTPVTSGQDISKLAEEVVESVQKTHVLNGYTVSLGAHVGIALYPEHGKKKSTLLRHADIALSESIKQNIPFRIFTPELKDSIVERMELQNGILLALEALALPDEKPQFELYFHPQIYCSKDSSGKLIGRVTGAETLIRWNHPTKGNIPPSKFIPVAEETGLIIPLGHWILRTALGYIQDLARLGYGNMGISVNFSSAQFNHEDISLTILELLERRKISPKMLKLEITESGLMRNFSATKDKIQNLRNHGLKILVDDFGTGYSSLSYLKDLPIDVVKIDKSFIDGVTQDSSDQALTKAIITLATDLGLDIIVEGTETLGQIQWLMEKGCHIFQGYYFSKPIPYKDFLVFLKHFPEIFKEKMLPKNPS